MGTDPVMRLVCRTTKEAYDSKLREDFEEKLVSLLGHMGIRVKGRTPMRYMLRYVYHPTTIEPVYMCSGCGRWTSELCGCDRCRKRKGRRQFMRRFMWYVFMGAASSIIVRFAAHSIRWVR